MKALKPLVIVILLVLGQLNLFSSRLIRIPITLRKNVKIELADISEVYQIVDSTSFNSIEPTEFKYVVRYASDNQLVLLSQPYNPQPDVTNAVPINNQPIRLLIYRDAGNNDIRLTYSTDSLSIDSFPYIKLLYSTVDDRSVSDKIITGTGEAFNLVNDKVLPVIDLQKEQIGNVIKPLCYRRLKVLGIAFLWDSYIVVALDEATSKTYHIRTAHTFTPPGERLIAFIQGMDEPQIENTLKNENWQRIVVGKTYDFLISDQIITDYGLTILIKTKTVDLKKVFGLNNIIAPGRGTVYESANMRGLYISNDTSIKSERYYPNAHYAVIQNDDHGTNIYRWNSNWSNSEKDPLFFAKQYLYMLCWELSQKIGLKTDYQMIMDIKL